MGLDRPARSHTQIRSASKPCSELVRRLRPVCASHGSPDEVTHRATRFRSARQAAQPESQLVGGRIMAHRSSSLLLSRTLVGVRHQAIRSLKTVPEESRAVPPLDGRPVRQRPEFDSHRDHRHQPGHRTRYLPTGRGAGDMPVVAVLGRHRETGERCGRVAEPLEWSVGWAMVTVVAVRSGNVNAITSPAVSVSESVISVSIHWSI